MTTRPSIVDKFDIRPLADAEQDSVAALWRACDLVVSYNPPAHDIAFCRASPSSELFVAVDPALRGENLGRRMVAHAEDWLRSLGVRKINLMIRETNREVRAFYERIGYSVEPRTAMARWIVDKPE